ncbi:MAG: hypothetical protein J2P28_21765, partial [Actinobacteria bacterium]|nr:hypothetical protein [Actinomycetota bacterium]
KGPHAENALRLYYLRGEDPRSRKGRQPGRGHGNYLSDEAVATQADVLAQARLLNARGPGPGYLKMRPEAGHGDG